MTTYRLERLARLPAAERGLTIGDFLVPIAIGERLGVRIYHLGLVALGALVIALSALISIPLPGTPVPITGQTFGVLVVATSLGYRRGIASTLLYIAVGVVGIPTFAESRAGLGVIASLSDGRLILGATGGYLVGFLLAGGVVGRLAELGWDRHLGRSIVAMLVGSVAIYAVAIPWLAASASYTVEEAIAKGLLPFVVGDLLKVALAAGIFPVAWWLVGRRPHER